jgi:DNA-binding FadR family transcriptional regulator
MNSKYRNWLQASGLLMLLALPFAANADLPGKHPAYLHALTDLREARWMLEHRAGDAAVSRHEDVAIMQIDKTIEEIKHAAIDDGKDVHDHPSADVAADRPGRLHKALELLRKVHSDVAREEDDPMTRGLRDRAVGHLDAAIHATEKSIFDVEHGH